MKKDLTDQDIAEGLDAMRPQSPDPAFTQRVLSAAALIRQEKAITVPRSPLSLRRPQIFWAFAGLGAGILAAALLLVLMGNLHIQGGAISQSNPMNYSYMPIEDVLRPMMSQGGGLRL